MVWRITTKLNNNNNNNNINNKLPISYLLVLICSLMSDVFTGGVGAVVWMSGGGSGGGHGSQTNVGIAIAVTVMAGLAVAATLVYSNRGHLQSPWSRRRRKHAVQPKLWKTLFDEDGRLIDGGVKFLKKVRSGGVHPSLRPEVWPFLLGVFDLKSSKEERDAVKNKNREEYEKLRKQCEQTYTRSEETTQIKEISESNENEDCEDSGEVLDPASPKIILSTDQNQTDDLKHCEVSDESEITSKSEEVLEPSSPESPLSTGQNQNQTDNLRPSEAGEGSEITSKSETDSSDSDSSSEIDDTGSEKPTQQPDTTSPSMGGNKTLNLHRSESFATWQRIIRLDAIRANDEWIVYTPSQAAVDSTIAHELANSVCLKDYTHLEACRIFHAARLVSILEAYALYDSEIGYCQGMSDLLSPIISVVEDDSEAFWCFVGFMKKARHNFRLDEVGIRRQLNIVSKIIKGKDSHLYRHLEELQAEDCFFVYRMVVVLFRRELNFEQTLCLWEVMWADQTAIRAGIAKSAWGRMRMRAPPTDDLLLYAIAACVLQKRKQIIEKYSSMDEILRECNNMTGHLDVWKLLDDAHDLVVTLHDKI